jgi:hypothetical protein
MSLRLARSAPMIDFPHIFRGAGYAHFRGADQANRHCEEGPSILACRRGNLSLASFAKTKEIKVEG